MVAVVAIIAIVAAMLLIAWARVAVHGTEDIQEVILDPLVTEELTEPRVDTRLPEEREVEGAAASSRFATGFSQ